MKSSHSFDYESKIDCIPCACWHIPYACSMQQPTVVCARVFTEEEQKINKNEQTSAFRLRKRFICAKRTRTFRTFESETHSKFHNRQHRLMKTTNHFRWSRFYCKTILWILLLVGTVDCIQLYTEMNRVIFVPHRFQPCAIHASKFKETEMC